MSSKKYYQRRYYPKRPVKSFQDLEVYQKTLGLAVEIVKKIKNTSVVERKKLAVEVNQEITKNLIERVLVIPKLIATAHSVRFGDSERAIATLEEAMLSCNLSVVYLEKFRDLVNQKIEAEYFEEQIKEYLRVRGKIMRLQKSWIKFMRPREEKTK